MKKLFALLPLFLLSVVAALAQAETIDLGPRGKITLYLLGDWRIDTTQFGRQASISISPVKSSSNASCTLQFEFPEQDRFDTKARLKLRVEADNQAAAEESVEGKAIAREFSLTKGFGFYCNFTDPTLRGKPPEKGNYKVGSFGRIRLAPDVLIQVAVMSDGFSSEEHQQLLGAVEGMEFTPGRGR